MKMAHVTVAATVNRRIIGLALASVMLAGCRSQRPSVKARVEVTRIPVASIGGPDQMDDIEGAVRGKEPNQEIVIYAHSGLWWVQPFANQPFTKIQPDSTWKSFTHLGTEYAALLVENGYRPAAKVEALPEEGNGVVAVAIVKGQVAGPGLSKILPFSGYDWIVRSTESDHGGEPNAYDPANASTDEKGFLHLRMMQRNDKWTCAEVSLNHSLGYGTYTFVLRDTAHLAPSAVTGFFTWDDSHSEGFHNELDIELSRWGDPGSRNAQFVVQPFYAPDNFFQFNTPPGEVTYRLRWQPESATFDAFAGPPDRAKPVSEHRFTAGIPNPASETVRIDLYDFHHAEHGSEVPAEVVVEKFEYSR